MKRGLGIVLAGMLLAGLWAAGVSAHVLKTDGTIGAVLHIEPDDAPASGVATTYIVSFSDTTSRLDLHHCICAAELRSSNGAVVATQSLAATYTTDSQDTIVFPSPDVYTLTIRGRPVTANAFQPFSVQYSIRVTGGSTAPQPFPPLLLIGNCLLAGLLFLSVYAASARRTASLRHRSG